MALNANALVSLADAKAELSLETGPDAPTEALINAASTWAEHICKRPLKAKAISMALRGPSGYELYVKANPISTAVAPTVTVNSDVQTVWKNAADGDPEDFDVLVGPTDEMADMTPDHFYRSTGWAPTSTGNPYNVVLTFTGGFATVPANIQRACLLLIQKLSRDKVQQTWDLQAIQGSGAPGSMSFRGSPVPLEAMKLLEPYILWTVG